MSAATLSPAMAGADLRDELHALLGRHDGASSLDELREFADDLTALMRRTRGRITRLTRKAAEQPAPKAEAAAEPAPAIKTEHEPAAPAQAVDQTPPSPAAPRALRRLPVAMLTALRARAARARTRVVRWSVRAARVGRSAARHFGNFVWGLPSRGDPDASNRAGGSPTGPGGVR